ncbi:DUF4407 domain-containing protein [Actinoplanes sp. LDG1-06]|uniref:DUF4407 domain-containing protein n=1 Tax=Paractinoplanes ovalisporus TaxID=2810368 RepID=A0ABS2AS66_9ACTN|nr:DUF4407 domain-containing protein [Actinoplanes ovalisporus]MBM2622041.1 DUF4407 domain-containing protein [Actinoplanes ovalisporus]
MARSPRERRKFSGLGGVVLTTSCMAAVSAAFALHNGARAPLWVALVVAVLWGVAIANLDRWLVAAASRRDKWWQNLGTLVPRLLLALVIGAVVSTPLVLWIFQSEIQAQLTVTQQAERNAFETNLRNDARFAVIPALEKEVNDLQKTAAGAVAGGPVSDDPAVARAQTEFDRIDKQYTAAQASAICEFDGTCGTGKKGGGSAYKTKLKVAQDLRAQRDAAKQRLDAAQNAALTRQSATASGQQADARQDLPAKQEELARLKSLKAQEEDAYLVDSRNDRGLLAQIEALSKITDSNGTLKTAYLTLLLFITAIEILPVFTKFLLNIGKASAYDEILASAERTDVEVAKANLKLERERREKEYAERAEREAEVDADLRNREIARWRSDEIRRMKGQRTARTTTTSRWRSALPGQRADRQTTVGYNEWPDEEERDGAGGETTSFGGSDGTANGWRFRD